MRKSLLLAVQLVSVESDRDHYAFIRKCVAKLGTDKSVIIRGDVFKFIKTCHQQFDFIFADSPYALECLAEIPLLIFAHDLLAEDGIFVFEHGKGNGFSDMPQFIERRTYGSVKFSLFRIKPSS